MNDRTEWQEFKDSTLEMIKKLEAELEPTVEQVEQIEFLYNCIACELTF